MIHEAIATPDMCMYEGLVVTQCIAKLHVYDDQRQLSEMAFLVITEANCIYA